MSVNSSIEWTDATWTPLRARVREDAPAIALANGYTSLLPILRPGKEGPHCEHVSPGCEHCYSETNNERCLPTNGTGLPFDRRSRDLVDIFVDEDILAWPLHWKKPRKIFVCSQTDLFGEWVTDDMIIRVFETMLEANHHTYQVLTKRADRMRNFITGPWWAYAIELYLKYNNLVEPGYPKPLPNVWLGVSCEDQPTANERIGQLLKTPAAVRFASYEPALEPVDFLDIGDGLSALTGWHDTGKSWEIPKELRGIDWLIAGGESGSRARPAKLRWFRDARDQCEAAGVAFFMKQFGGNIGDEDSADCQLSSGRSMHDRKGGNPEEWPYDLRIRQFPFSSERKRTAPDSSADLTPKKAGL